MTDRIVRQLEFIFNNHIADKDTLNEAVNLLATLNDKLVANELTIKDEKLIAQRYEEKLSKERKRFDMIFSFLKITLKDTLDIDLTDDEY